MEKGSRKSLGNLSKFTRLLSVGMSILIPAGGPKTGIQNTRA